MSIFIAPSLRIQSSGDINENNPVIGYKNIVSTSNVAASSAEDDFPVTNLANPNTVLPWVATSDADQLITITPGVTPVDYVGIAGHNFGTIKAKVSVETQYGGVWSTASPAVIADTDAPMIFRFLKNIYTGVRVRIADAFDVPEAAVMYVGEITTMQRRIYVGHSPLNLVVDPITRTGMSDAGQFLGTIQTGGKYSTSLTLANLTPGWYRSVFLPMSQVLRTEPFFFSWRPQGYPREVGYCWRTSPIIPKNDRTNGMMSVNFNMSGMIE